MGDVPAVCGTVFTGIPFATRSSRRSIRWLKAVRSPDRLSSHSRSRHSSASVRGWKLSPSPAQQAWMVSVRYRNRRMGWLPERDFRVLVSYMPVSRAAAPSGAALRMVMSRARSPSSPSMAATSLPPRYSPSSRVRAPAASRRRMQSISSTV